MQGRNGERHNWNLDVGRDLFGGDALWQGGGRGPGRHAGLNHVVKELLRFLKADQLGFTSPLQGSFDKNSTVRDCATIFALSLMTRYLISSR